ncbi:MAG TPA: class I SAM-dependent methyltransferase [Bryobacterales bacterium]|jgi:2-polyprenyl-3-methyl-5-hydroxy-6-metoxy-1,4-benzoquinol methylase|nr:class I SAM-dependent methyltransferase [Bryobacterales bacterium]
MTSEEIAAVVEEIRQRVRARYQKQVDGVPDFCVPSLIAAAQARDAALGKVASIGTVNPRPPGLVNSIIQGIKRAVSRALAWHVREQVEFNRAVIEYMERSLAVLEEHNRNLLQLAQLARDALDAARNVSEWRTGWVEKATKSEIQMLRSIAELQGAFQHRVSLLESNFREHIKSQHADYLRALERTTLDVQRRLWDDLAKIRQEYERQREMQTELRLIRQRMSAWGPSAAQNIAVSASPPAAAENGTANLADLDYARFAERFRGSAAHVAESQIFYVPLFQGRRRVLDLGCGRGEFLEIMRQNGIGAAGVDSDAESVLLCREKGLDVIQADLFAHLSSLPDESLDGVFCAQVVEHIPPLRLPGLVKLISQKLERGGVAVIETPNPECLAIFATNFYLDPTHVRPVPAALLHFYFEESGLGAIEIHQRAPAAEQFPEIAALAEVTGLAGFQKRFLGGLDYAIVGRKL